MNEELMKVLDDEEFAEKLANAETAEEFVALLGSKDVQIEEGMSAEEAFKVFKSQENGEIAEGELENVSGGVLGAIVVGAGIVVGANAIAFAGGYIYQKIKNRKKKKK